MRMISEHNQQAYMYILVHIHYSYEYANIYTTTVLSCGVVLVVQSWRRCWRRASSA